MAHQVRAAYSTLSLFGVKCFFKLSFHHDLSQLLLKPYRCWLCLVAVAVSMDAHYRERIFLRNPFCVKRSFFFDLFVIYPLTYTLITNYPQSYPQHGHLGHDFICYE